MKKLFYILLLVSLSTAAITSCTEEEVKPQAEKGSNSGGVPIKE